MIEFKKTQKSIDGLSHEISNSPILSKFNEKNKAKTGSLNQNEDGIKVIENKCHSMDIEVLKKDNEIMQMNLKIIFVIYDVLANARNMSCDNSSC